LPTALMHGMAMPCRSRLFSGTPTYFAAATVILK
jgi:hypothetical protein